DVSYSRAQNICAIPDEDVFRHIMTIPRHGSASRPRASAGNAANTNSTTGRIEMSLENKNALLSQARASGNGAHSPALAADTISIPGLRAAIHGRVIAPGDADYDAARTLHVGGFDHRPAAIVRVADAADVAHVVSLARETGTELAIRSGGHSSAGHSMSDGG